MTAWLSSFGDSTPEAAIAPAAPSATPSAAAPAATTMIVIFLLLVMGTSHQCDLRPS